MGLIGFSAWRAFWSKLTRAQGCADSATCGQCDTYGQFDVVVESEAVPVRYRRCGHERTIHR